MASRRFLEPIERCVMERVAAGRTDKEIAFYLEITRPAVSAIVRNATMKARAKTRTEAVVALINEDELDEKRIGLLRAEEDS